MIFLNAAENKKREPKNPVFRRPFFGYAVTMVLLWRLQRGGAGSGRHTNGDLSTLKLAREAHAEVDRATEEYS